MSLSKFASATAISLGGNFNKLLSIIIGAAVFSNPLSALQVNLNSFVTPLTPSALVLPQPVTLVTY